MGKGVRIRFVGTVGALAACLVAGVLRVGPPGNGPVAHHALAATTAASSSPPPATWNAYVTVQGNNVVQPFNTQDDALGSVINLGHGQRAVALSPDDRILYVTNQAGSFAWENLVTGANNQNVGSGLGNDPNDVAVTPNGLTAYVTDVGGAKLVAFDAISKSIVASISIGTNGNGPTDLAITPDGTEVLATVPALNEVVAISTATNTITTTVTGITDPYGIAVTPDGTTAWVTDATDGTVVPLDIATLTFGTPISVGAGPQWVAITPDGTKAFVANTGTDTVTPIDLKTRKALKAVTVGNAPTSIAITPDGVTAFVVDSTAGEVNPIVVGTDSVKPSFSVKGSPALGIAIDPDQAPVAQMTVTPAAPGKSTLFDASASTVKFGTIVKYAWSFGDGSSMVTATPTVQHTYLAAGWYMASVVETDSAGTSLTKIFTGHVMSRNGGPSARATRDVRIGSPATPAWSAYVTNRSSNSVTPIDVAANTAGSAIALPAGSEPAAVAITPNAAEAYVASQVSDEISVIDTSSNTIATNVTLGASPDAVAITPDGRTAWVAESTGALVPISTATHTAGAAVTIGGTPVAIAIVPLAGGLFAYVAESAGSVAIVNLDTATTVGTVTIGGTLTAIVVTPDYSTVWVASSTGDLTAGSVVPIATQNDTAGTSITVGDDPDGIAITPDGSRMYVANGAPGADTVTPITLATGKVGSAISVGTRPSGIAVTPNGATAYVVDTGSNDVDPVTTATAVVGSAITVGTLPSAIAITPDQAPDARLAVTSLGAPGGPATSFDASASSVAYGTITAYFWNFGDGATALTATPTTTHVYATAGAFRASVTEVSSGGTTSTFVFTGQTASLNGGPAATAVRMVGFTVPEDAYVTDFGNGNVTPIDITTNTAGTAISVGSPTSDPTSVAIAPGGLTAWVLDQATAKLVPIATVTGSAGAAISLGATSTVTSVVVSPDGSTAYVLETGTGSGAGALIPVNTTKKTAGTPISTGTGASAFALTPDGTKAYVVNRTAGTVTPVVLSAGKTLPPIHLPTGSSPDAIAITPDGSTAYVVDAGTNEVTPINLATGAAGTPVSLGAGASPDAIAITPDGTTAYVVDAGTNALTPITVASNSAGTPVSLGSTPATPKAIAITPDGTAAYVVDSTKDAAIPVTLATATAGAPISTGAGSAPDDIAITPLTRPAWGAYVPDVTAGEVWPFSTATRVVGSAITVGAGPSAIAITPDASKAYVANTAAGTVTPINLATGAAGSAISFGATSAPDGVAITPNGATAWVALFGSGLVVPIATATDSAGSGVSLGAGAQPIAIAITPDGSTGYVVVQNGAANSLVPIDLATGTIGTAINLSSGVGADAVAITPDGTLALVADKTAGTVTPVDLTLQVVLPTVVAGSNPVAIAITPDGETAYVVNDNSPGTVTPITISPMAPLGPITAGSNPDAIAITPDGQTAFAVDPAVIGGGHVIPISTVTNTAGTAFALGTAPDGIAITPDQAPVAQLAAASGTLGAPTVFDASASTVAYGSIVSYAWDFGDGTTAVTASPVTTHSFTTAGSYTVTVTETDTAGTSTTQVFTGQTVEQNGGPSAVATVSTTVTAAYHPINPVRILDTRAGSGYPQAGNTLHANSSLVLQVTNAAGDGVPVSATAVVMNVTAVNATALSYLTVWPTGHTMPLASNLNFVKGQIEPNLVEIELGTGGKVSIYNYAGSVDVIADVEGYVGPSTVPGAGLYHAVAPYRVCDTRPAGTGVTANQCDKTPNHTLGAKTTLRVQVTGWPNGGSPPSTGTVPAEPGVSAVVLNVTATDTTAWSFLTIWPDGKAMPTASNLNWTKGGVSVANRVIVPVSTSGWIDVYNYGGSADVVVDVGGWFTDGSNPSATGAGFNGVVPARICDTRKAGTGVPSNQCDTSPNGTLSSGSVIHVQVAGLGNVPTMSATTPPVAVVLNVTATNTTANGGYFTVWPDGNARPRASDVNWSKGETVPNLVIVRLGSDGIVNVYNFTGGADLIIDVVGWYG